MKNARNLNKRTKASLILLGVTLVLVSGCLTPEKEAQYKIDVSAWKDNSSNESNINKSKENQVTLLYFWSAYCGWCKKQDPIVNRTLEKHPSLNLVIIDVNKKENRELMKKYKAFGTPTFILMKGNETRLKAPGFLPEEKFEKFICLRLEDERCREVKDEN